jgi:hypothetical protein
MNIFILDEDIETCARYHVDKHVVKMILESAQLLSGAVRLSGIDAGYRLTHQNHPCSIWTRESLSNWIWLRDLTAALNDEYRFRYCKSINHKSYDIVRDMPQPNIDDIGLTRFQMAMPDEYRTDDVVESYRIYYKQDKRDIAAWKNREQPYWWE